MHTTVDPANLCKSHTTVSQVLSGVPESLTPAFEQRLTSGGHLLEGTTLTPRHTPDQPIAVYTVQRI